MFLFLAPLSAQLGKPSAANAKLSSIFHETFIPDFTLIEIEIYGFVSFRGH
jgi:hypothetical protein